MTTATLFWILLAVVMIGCAIYTVVRKLRLASEGHKFIIDCDAVEVSEDELQDFMLEVEEKAVKGDESPLYTQVEKAS